MFTRLRIAAAVYKAGREIIYARDRPSLRFYA
jgi:hypothetical protein